MKKYTFALIGIVVMGLVLMSFVPSANAGGVWSLVKNSGMETRNPKSFQIEVEGVNIRAYVFDVPEMKSICINTWGEDVQQLECKTYKEIGIKETK